LFYFIIDKLKYIIQNKTVLKIINPEAAGKKVISPFYSHGQPSISPKGWVVIAGKWWRQSPIISMQAWDLYYTSYRGYGIYVKIIHELRLHYAQWLKDIANKITYNISQKGVLLDGCIHLRFENDWPGNWYTSPQEYLDALTRLEPPLLPNQNKTLYVCAGAIHPKDIVSISSQYNLVYKTNFITSELLPSQREFAAIIDELVCLTTPSFIGNKKSSFSMWVAKLMKAQYKSWGMVPVNNYNWDLFDF